jgi:hypothetical protein
MAITLFDAHTGFGGLANAAREHVPLDDLLDAMQRLDLAGGLVRTVPDDRERNWPEANRLLYEASAPRDGLVPCPVLVPSTGRDYPPEAEQVADAVAHGAGAAWLRPKTDAWVIRDWACGALLRALQDRRLPAFILERDLPLEQLGDLAATCPGLPLILAGPDFRLYRTLLPLLETFANIRLALGTNFALHRGVEHLVSVLGPERILFGTGFPEGEPAMYVTQLMYADIPDDARTKIGSENIRRLMEGIRR